MYRKDDGCSGRTRPGNALSVSSPSTGWPPLPVLLTLHFVYRTSFRPFGFANQLHSVFAEMFESPSRIRRFAVAFAVVSLLTERQRRSAFADVQIVPPPIENATDIRIGYFMQESQPPYRIGAIQLAIDRARADGLLPGYSIRYCNPYLETAMRCVDNHEPRQLTCGYIGFYYKPGFHRVS